MLFQFELYHRIIELRNYIPEELLSKNLETCQDVDEQELMSLQFEIAVSVPIVKLHKRRNKKRK